MDLGTEEASSTFVVGEDGQGLAYVSHPATATDVVAMVDACGVYDPTVDYNVRVNGYGTGLAPPTLDEYADMVGTANMVTDVALAPGGELPSAVDWSTSPYMPVADSQGGQGSCGSWAVSYYANGFLQAKDNDFSEAHNGSNKSHLMSPAWVYNKINYGVDSGSNWYRNHALISSVGNADWDTMPYDWRDLYGWGDEGAWRIAPRYRVRSTYDLASTSSTMVIKAWLAEGYILPMAFDANQYGHLSDDDIISAVEYSSNTANHANTIVGYNDSVTADGEAGAFLIVNSWGKTWSGDGYWWMTYDCLKELYWPVLRMYDYVDYEPKLIGTLNQSTPASKDCRITMGTDSKVHADRQPLWWAGTRPYPAFMCLDITELADDVGLADFFLYYGSGTTVGTLSSFEVEWYPRTYDPGNPLLVAESEDVPKRAAATVWAAFEGIHIDHTAPAEDTWHRGVVEVNGTASTHVERPVLSEDFEGRWLEEWTTEDAETSGGLDTWGTSMNRMDAGDKSAYCAGSDAGIVLFEDFDEGGFMPAQWSSTSLATYQYPWAVKNSGYQGCGGTDYLVATRSDRGAGFNNTERLYMNSPVNASSFENLVLRFYVEYDWKDGDEYLRVLYAKGTSHPNWTVLDTLTADTFGYQSYDLSALDNEREVYLAFEYHGTEDLYATIDDVLLAGEKNVYDGNMKADMYIATGGLSDYDHVNMSYDFWVDSEAGVDILSSVYRTSSSGPWKFLANHSGAGKAWTPVEVTVPTNATHVGFRFISDGANVSEGAYVDDVALVGFQNLSGIDVSVDGGPWDTGIPGAVWEYGWNTTGLDDGPHQLVARANYSNAFDYTAFTLRTDNTAPTVSEVSYRPLTTGDPEWMYINATDVNGIGEVWINFSFNAKPWQELQVVLHDDTTWSYPVIVPTDAVELAYSLRLNDTLGNELVTDVERIPVTDNDDPHLRTDSTMTTATTGDPFTFQAQGIDNVMVDRVVLEYWYGDDEGNAVTLQADGDVLRETIDVPHVLDVIRYRFTVVDATGNSVTTAVTNVTIFDNDLPEFGPDGTPTEGYTGENVTLAITARDNIQLESLWVEYRLGDGETTNVSLGDGSIGNLTHTVDIPWDSLAPLRYTFKALDSSGNWNATPLATVTVVDTLLPWFGEDSTPGEATTGDPIDFVVDLFDNIAIGRAWVEYWYGGEEPIIAELTDGNGLTWTGDPLVRDTYLAIWYVIHIEDTWGNHNTTEARRIIVLDDDGPFIVLDGSPEATTTGVDYGFSLRVEDNLDVERVNVTYWYGDGTPATYSMDASNADGNGNGTYRLLIDIPGDSTESLHYTFTVMDASGNTNVTGERTVPVLDVTAPVAVAGADITIDQHEELTFSSEGSYDNVGLIRWTWSFTDVDGSRSLEGAFPRYTFHEAGSFTVTLTVRDPSGNVASDTMDVTVRDVTDPVPHAGTDRTVDQNTTVFLDGSGSTDNVAISSWTWSFVYDGSPRELAGQDLRFTFTVPGVYRVTLTVTDRSGNSAATSVNVTVKDTIDPVPVTPKDSEGGLDETKTFSGSRSTDNVGIVNYTWIVVKPSGNVVELYGEKVEYELDEPGDHEVTLAVTDADGNTVTSDPFYVHVPNVMLWFVLIAIVLASVVATAAVALHTRRKTRRMDEQRKAKR